MMAQIQNIKISKYKHNILHQLQDDVAIEEPLEISIAYYQNNIIQYRTIAVTMRTPGHDEQLALGFLFTENIIASAHKIEKIEHKGDNKLCVYIANAFVFETKNASRNFYMTSSCGVCGKASIDAIKTQPSMHHYPVQMQVPMATILNLPQQLRAQQSAFESTGGIHACALFNEHGEEITIYEDVGRHNALDKLIGHQFQTAQLPLQKNILLLSGRASFELIQKAAMAHLPIVCAIGAPSSLAVALAQEMDITLIGFLKNDSCNIYCGAERILLVNE
jgi:FdhD protein